MRHAGTNLLLRSLVLGVVAAALLAGCSRPHLAGTNDAALEYAVLADPATGATLGAPLVAAGVKARLSAGQIPSDVEVVGAAGNGRVRVVVDADVAGVADDLLTWRGGLQVSRIDDAYVLAPPDTSGLHPVSTAGGAGPGERRWWQGPGEAVARAVRATNVGPDHGVFAEKVPGGEYRTRVVALPPFVTLGLAQTPLDAIEPALRGRALSVSLPPASRAPLEQERALHPGEPVALTRGSSLLGTARIDELAAGPIVLRFGDDLVSYTRASRAKDLLRSPVLPPLRRVWAGALPPRWRLAAACALLPLLTSLGWLLFVRRFDRARPEPWWLVLATFALGALSIVPAGLIELGCAWLTPWLDPSLVTLGGQLWALPLSVAVATLVVGGAEEGAKLLGAWSLARHRREFDEPVDGVVYGCASALGFAAVENVKYFAFGRMSGVVIAMRTLETVPAHMFFGALWGYGMGRTLVSRRARIAPWLALAALAHGVFDALLSTDGMQIFATLLVLGLAVAFIAVLRSALRHGAVPAATMAPAGDEAPSTQPLPASELPRVLHRVGSKGAFAACSAAMVLCAFALTVLGTVFELLHRRANPVVIAIGALLLGLFGLSAWGVSATIPLDVVIDARGLTYAGGRTAWAAITGHRVEASGQRASVILETPDGEVRIGPTRPQTASSIDAAIRAARAF